MQVNIGFFKSENQISMAQLNFQDKNIEKSIVDSVDLKELNFGLLLTDQSDDLSGLEKTFEAEQRYYPIVNANTLGLEKTLFEDMSFEELANLYTKVNARWILNTNMQTIEQSYSMITYLKNLYQNDWNSFFEELWFIFKSNLATSELTFLIHDLKQPSEKAEQKGEKPSLTFSAVSGTKVPNIRPAKEEETKLMEAYQEELTDIFHIQEVNQEKGQLVINAKIDASPILIMAKVNGINQLQKSILSAIMKGLQTS